MWTSEIWEFSTSVVFQIHYSNTLLTPCVDNKQLQEEAQQKGKDTRTFWIAVPS